MKGQGLRAFCSPLWRAVKNNASLGQWQAQEKPKIVRQEKQVIYLFIYLFIFNHTDPVCAGAGESTVREEEKDRHLACSLDFVLLGFCLFVLFFNFQNR